MTAERPPRGLAALAPIPLLVVLAIAPGPFAAADDAPALAGDAAPLQLVVNGVDHEVVTVRVVGDEDVWVPLSALETSGLRQLGGQRRTADGHEWVSLRSLSPLVVFGVDEAALALRIHAQPELLGRAVLDEAATRRPAGLLAQGDPSAFVNYATQVDDQRRITAFGEVGAGAASWLATSGISRLATGEVVRGLSAVTRDEVPRLRRWTAGDAVATAGPLGGTVVLGGFGIAREFALDPWFVRQPLPRTSAVALTPSTLEVYVNGRLVRRTEVAPGTVDLMNLPVEAGAGNVRTVLRDAYGRIQELEGGYYFSGGLLAPGVTDYALHAGLRREALGAESFTYGDALVVGRYRAGITDALTAGARLEAGLDVVSAGPSLTAALPIGEVELAAGLSAESGRGGAAASAGWAWTSRRMSTGLRLAALSPSYAHGSLGSSQDRALTAATAYAAWPVPFSGTVGIEGSLSRSRDLGSGGGTALRASFGLGGGTSLIASIGWAQPPGGSPGATGMVLLTRSFHRRATASATAERSPDGFSRTRIGYQQALPSGSGFGYRLDASTGRSTDLDALAQYQGERGRLEAGVQRALGRESGYASIAGGLVLMERGLFPTRPVQDGFALVQVPGVAGVRTYLNGQEVGRTDAAGNLLVPGLLPYHANKIGIRAADVPIDYSLAAVERLVAPPRRLGARVRFDVQRVSTLTGTISVDAGGAEITPSYGELRILDTAVEPSPLGADGRFFLSDVPAGRHVAEVVYARGVCRVALEVPPPVAAVTDLGAIRCSGSDDGALRIAAVE